MKKNTPHKGGVSKGAELSNDKLYTHPEDASPKLNKKARILLHLFNGGSLNRFEAEGMGDHCLNSTMSTFKNSHGINSTRKREKVPTRFGKPTSVNRYRLAPESKDVARRFLEAQGALSDQGQ